MFFQLVISFCLVGASYSITDADLVAWFIRQGVECSKDHPITPEQFQMMRQYKIPDNTNAKCLMSCIMRKAKLIDSKGLFDYESARLWAEKEYADDAKKLELTKNLHEMCKKVNEEKVTDGEKGCDRSFYLAKCLIENAPKNGIKI